MNKDDLDDKVDAERRRFLVTATSVLGGVGVAFAAVPFVSSWWPTAKAEALAAPVEVDISKLEYGQQLTVAWRSKPVWIIRRSKEVLDRLNSLRDELRDPDSVASSQPVYAANKYRALNPEYLVLIGVCTHLGCAPKYEPDIGSRDAKWPGGFFCPCHGSTFDLAGRVFKGVPAPINLEVPPYAFADKNTIIIGVDSV